MSLLRLAQEAPETHLCTLSWCAVAVLVRRCSAQKVKSHGLAADDPSRDLAERPAFLRPVRFGAASARVTSRECQMPVKRRMVPGWAGTAGLVLRLGRLNLRTSPMGLSSELNNLTSHRVQPSERDARSTSRGTGNALIKSPAVAQNDMGRFNLYDIREAKSRTINWARLWLIAHPHGLVCAALPRSLWTPTNICA
jgi:hypothetical protein